MYIVQVATEMDPVAKVGGLGDVVYGLSRELERNGHAVEVILPKYDCMRYDQIHALTPVYNDLWVPWYGGSIHCTVLSGLVHHVKCLFIDAHSNDLFFNRFAYYGQNDDYMRWAFFSKAALEFMLKTNRRPDVIHCHDWQTGLLPVMLFELYKNAGLDKQRVCYTIHNFKHQGQAPAAVLNATGLGRPDFFYSKDRLQDDFNKGCINYMKGGIVFSNYVNTVSPHHAWEVRHTPLNYGLGNTLDKHQDKFGGILNGLDQERWNPENDIHIPFGYTAETYERKLKNKEALQERFNLNRDLRKPIFAYVGRLDDQKGLHLIRHALFWSIQNGCQFVLVGPPSDSTIDGHFKHLKNHLSGNRDCHLHIGFSNELGRLLYAGADYLVVPSLFEPCGLVQMISLRYGTPPIVRYTGGLADTVFDWDNDTAHPREERNGFVFHQEDYWAIESALVRAKGLYLDAPEYYKQLALQGMKYNFSWSNFVQHYINVYNLIQAK